MPQQHLPYSIIDVWCTLLNEKEKYRAPESPLRLLFDIGFSIGPLDDTKMEDAQYEIFSVEMDHFFERYPNMKIEDYDLIFFPILQNEHYYLVCINKKEDSYEVIDNIRVGRAVTNMYAKNVRTMKRHFVKYLKEKEHTSLVKRIEDMTVSYLSLRWQTFENRTDCGIFLMRHMETYKGSMKNWTTQLRTERTGQKGQIEKLRTKYANAILTSDLNERGKLILEQANRFYKVITTETISNIVITETISNIVIVESTGTYKRKRFKIPGTVLFPDNYGKMLKKLKGVKKLMDKMIGLLLLGQ